MTEQELIKQLECQNIEYKEVWRDDYLKWICGYANAGGGKIYLGVDDSRRAVGVVNAEKLLEDIPNKIVATMGIVADVNLIYVGEHKIIEIEVSPSAMPISYHGIYYYRSGSTRQELNGLALQQFMLKKMGVSWDDIPMMHAGIDDLDRGAIDYFLRKGIAAERISNEDVEIPTQMLMENLDLVSMDGKLKSAAILLFGKRVGRYFPGVEFKIGRFHTSESDLIIQDEIEGNIIQMADRVMQVLKAKYLVSPIRYEGMQRIETLEIPEKALRELIYNAIVHRQYPGAPIQMRVYDDRIELWNEGGLPDGLSAEDLMTKHSSHPRNRNIARTFFKAGFIECWGRGYKKIREEMEKAGMPMPVIEEKEGGVLAIIKRKPMDEIIRQTSAQNNGVPTKNVGVNVGVKKGFNFSDFLKKCYYWLVKKRNISPVGV